MSSMEELLVQATPDLGGKPTGKSCICFATVNVGTISGRGSEIVEMLTRWQVDLCCFRKKDGEEDRLV